MWKPDDYIINGTYCDQQSINEALKRACQNSIDVIVLFVFYENVLYDSLISAYSSNDCINTSLSKSIKEHINSYKFKTKKNEDKIKYDFFNQVKNEILKSIEYEYNLGPYFFEKSKNGNSDIKILVMGLADCEINTEDLEPVCDELYCMVNASSIIRVHKGVKAFDKLEELISKAQKNFDDYYHNVINSDGDIDIDGIFKKLTNEFVVASKEISSSDEAALYLRDRENEELVLYARYPEATMKFNEKIPVNNMDGTLELYTYRKARPLLLNNLKAEFNSSYFQTLISNGNHADIYSKIIVPIADYRKDYKGDTKPFVIGLLIIQRSKPADYTNTDKKNLTEMALKFCITYNRVRVNSAIKLLEKMPEIDNTNDSIQPQYLFKISKKYLSVKYKLDQCLKKHGPFFEVIIVRMVSKNASELVCISYSTNNKLYKVQYVIPMSDNGNSNIKVLKSREAFCEKPDRQSCILPVILGDRAVGTVEVVSKDDYRAGFTQGAQDCLNEITGIFTALEAYEKKSRNFTFQEKCDYYNNSFEVFLARGRINELLRNIYTFTNSCSVTLRLLSVEEKDLIRFAAYPEERIADKDRNIRIKNYIIQKEDETNINSVNVWVLEKGRQCYMGNINIFNSKEEKHQQYYRQIKDSYENLSKFLSSRAKVVSTICLPVFVDGKIIGTLNLESRYEYEYYEEQYLISIAVQKIANIIRMARKRVEQKIISINAKSILYSHELIKCAQKLKECAQKLKELKFDVNKINEVIETLFQITKQDKENIYSNYEAHSMNEEIKKILEEQGITEYCSIKEHSKSDLGNLKPKNEVAHQIIICFREIMNNFRKQILSMTGGSLNINTARNCRHGGKKYYKFFFRSTYSQDINNTEDVYKIPIEKTDRYHIGAFICGAIIRGLGGDMFSYKKEVRNQNYFVTVLTLPEEMFTNLYEEKADEKV